MTAAHDSTLEKTRRLHESLTKQKLALVVEDDELDAALLIGIIASLGVFATMLAKDGKSAISLIDEKDFDVVFLDLRLGSAPDGIDVLRAAIGKVKFVIVTGLSENAPEAIEAMDIGAVKFITKPVNQDKIIEAII